MRTLDEHFDDLDRMVDNGTSVAKTREQIAFIWSQVTKLQTDHASLVEAHAKLQEEHLKLQAAEAARDAQANESRMDKAYKESEDYRKLLLSKQLSKG